MKVKFLLVTLDDSYSLSETHGLGEAIMELRRVSGVQVIPEYKASKVKTVVRKKRTTTKKRKTREVNPGGLLEPKGADGNVGIKLTFPKSVKWGKGKIKVSGGNGASVPKKRTVKTLVGKATGKAGSKTLEVSDLKEVEIAGITGTKKPERKVTNCIECKAYRACRKYKGLYICFKDWRHRKEIYKQHSYIEERKERLRG